MIKLFDANVSEESIEAVADVLRSGWIGQGPVTAEFEQKFAEYVGARHAIALNSATSALHLAVKACNLRPGDEVLTTSMTFVSTNHVLLYENLVPVFVDVEPGTLNMDLEKAEAAITPKTRAIMVVHYGGNPLDIERLYSLAERNGLDVIEDAAHACGASWNGGRIGSFGLTCFSFHAVKNLPLGDGGMITTNDDDLAQRIQCLRWLGIDKSTYARTAGGNYHWDYSVPEVGYKYHMNDINAAIGLASLPALDGSNQVRRYISDYYRANLKVPMLSTTPNSESSNHLAVIRAKNRDALYQHLVDRGISAGVHYKPNHYYPMYRQFVRAPLDVTEQAYREILSLPLHLKLTEENLIYICEVINAHQSA